jgi:hypothetical protein
MQNPERQIAVINDILLTDDPLSIYDLYITDRRIIVIDSKNYFGGSGIGGLIGSMLTDAMEQTDEASAKKQKELKEEFESLSLDEKLKSFFKNFAINYEEANQIILNGPHSRWRKATLKINSEKKHAKFQPTKEQFEQLSTILPSIEALKEKLAICKKES